LFPKPETRNPERRKAAGLSLVEQIVFIVVVGVGLAGVLAALNMATRVSVDPMTQKQALAIAEAMLEEVQLMSFTYCDPDDAQAATAESATEGVTGCSAGGVEAIGPEGSAPYGPEARTSATFPFDNVNDHHNFSMAGGITNIAGDAIAGLSDYSVSVTVAGQAIPAVGAIRAIPVTDSLLVTVTVTHPPTNLTLVLHGYRTRYAPNALP
jgi:MSHA pilin protein MshD